MTDRHRTCLTFLMVVFVCLGLGWPLAVRAQLISIQYRDEPVVAVIEKLSAGSGYAMEIRGIGPQVRVSGEVNRLTLEESLRKILKRFNYTIVWNEKEKKIRISVYDGSSGETTVGQPPASGGINRPDPSDPFASPPSLTPGPSVQHSGPWDDGISGAGIRFIQGTRTTAP